MMLRHFFQHVHFVGIGGAGMSAIAELLHRQGLQVSGSDASDSAVLRRLAGLGLQVHVGHDAAHLGRADVLVTSTAVSAQNPEVLLARSRGLPVVPRAQMLAELMRGRLGVAVAGTHGKTTTTALVASVLIATGAEPGFVIGGEMLAPGVPGSAATSQGAGAALAGPGDRAPHTGTNAGLGQGEVIVVEADESDASFLHLLPVLAVVTNIDTDHMATYGHSLDRLHGAFVDFIHRLPFYGTAVVCSDDPGVRAVLPRLQRPVLRYGLDEDAELRALDVHAGPGAQMRFTARQAGHADLPVVLNLAGEHNVRNALAAIAVARLLTQPEAPLLQALQSFGGTTRRFQPWGELPAQDGGRYTLIDDYGHHPVELAAVLAAARGAFPGRRLVAAFQPHRYSRTRDCLADFAAVLGQFDAVLLTEVYAAGEAPLPGADGASLAARVPGALFTPAVADMPAAIQALARAGDVVFTLGAGSIGQVPERLLQFQGVSA